MSVDANGRYIDKGRKTAGEEKDINGRGLPLLIVGALLLVLAGVIAFTAASLFVCIFFTGVMVIGAVFLTAGQILRRIG